MKRSNVPNSIKSHPDSKKPYKPIFPSQSSQSSSAEIESNQICRRFNVIYGRVSTRKHKRWENDGILMSQGNKLVLENNEKQIATSYHSNQVELDNLGSGNSFNVGNYEVEIQYEIFEQKQISYNVLCISADLQTMLSERIMDMEAFDEEIKTDLLSSLYTHPAALYAHIDFIRQFEEVSGDWWFSYNFLYDF